jgi:hypothetical protein
MKITSKLLIEIAQELDAGMKVFINKDTLEIKPILDWDDIMDNEPWEKEMEEIDRTWPNFAVITKMETWEAFKVMEEFIDEVEDEQFREGLIKILNRKSPFANFKAEVESSSYRQNWFDFKQMKYEEYASVKLNDEGFNIE